MSLGEPRSTTDPAAAKPDGYYSNARPDLVSQLPRPLGRVLDVGCGAGYVGPGLKDAGAEHLSGIEIDPEAASVARAHYDAVAVGPVEEMINQVPGPFDTILCYDVLEHLVDPWAVLKALHSVAAPGAHLQASVPNARHFSIMGNVVLRGTFRYKEWGLMDSTHLRWFTRRDITTAVEGAGWRVRSVGTSELTPRLRTLGRLTGGKALEFVVAQWYLLAIRD